MYNLQKNRTHILFKCFKNLLVTCVQLLKSKWIIFFNPTKQTECEANMTTTVQEKSIKKKLTFRAKALNNVPTRAFRICSKRTFYMRYLHW